MEQSSRSIRFDSIQKRVPRRIASRKWSVSKWITRSELELNVVLACGQVNRKWSVVRKARGQVRAVAGSGFTPRNALSPQRGGGQGSTAMPFPESGHRAFAPTKRRTIVAGARFIYVCTRSSFDKILDSFCRPRKSTNFYFSNRNSSIRSNRMQSKCN